MTKPWYRISNTGAGPARVDIYDEIGGGFLEGVSAAGFVADLAKVKGDLEVHINSPGGNVFDGITIYNAIAQRKGRVTTVIDGLAASAASFIAQAGKTRVIAPGAMMMIHDAHGLAIGNAADMRETADLLDKASDNLAGIYAAHTGRPAEGWRAAMREESWYTADEAIEAGLADRLAERPAEDTALAAAAKFDLSVFAKVPDWLRNADGDTTQHRHPGQACWDPDGDGDCDLTPEGDIDGDYWDSNGHQLQPVPGKPMQSVYTDAGQIAHTALSETEIAALRRLLRNADKYNADDRKRMAGNGHAMPDGSYPIEDEEDLHNAIHAVGRGGSDHDAIRRHIIKRAKALGKADAIPDNWNSDGSTGGTDDHADLAWLHDLLEGAK